MCGTSQACPLQLFSCSSPLTWHCLQWMAFTSWTPWNLPGSGRAAAAFSERKSAVLQTAAPAPPTRGAGISVVISGRGSRIVSCGKRSAKPFPPLPHPRSASALDRASSTTAYAAAFEKFAEAARAGAQDSRRPRKDDGARGGQFKWLKRPSDEKDEARMGVMNRSRFQGQGTASAAACPRLPAAGRSGLDTHICLQGI